MDALSLCFPALKPPSLLRHQRGSPGRVGGKAYMPLAVFGPCRAEQVPAAGPHPWAPSLRFRGDCVQSPEGTVPSQSRSQLPNRKFPDSQNPALSPQAAVSVSRHPRGYPSSSSPRPPSRSVLGRQARRCRESGEMSGEREQVPPGSESHSPLPSPRPSGPACSVR